MKYSWAPCYTTGSDNLAGCMGIILAESFSLDRLITKWDKKDYPVLMKLTKTTLKITAHYHTEPPQVNFVSVTSFFNPVHPADDIPQGGILGLDLLQPSSGYELHALVPQVQFKDRTVPVYDLSPILTVSRAYLDRFPFYPGCRVFEAHAETSSLDCAAEALCEMGKEHTVQLYAILAIGIPQENACRLLMEDKGYISHQKGDKADEIRAQKELLMKACNSILTCEAVEKERGVSVEYQMIYLLSVFSDPLIIDKEKNFSEGDGLIPTWCQVQFMYSQPAQEFVPLGRTFDDLRKTSFDKWIVSFTE